VMDICRTTVPPAVPVTPGHRSACWLHQEEADGEK